MERRLIGEYAAIHSRTRYGATGDKVLPYLLPHALALRPASLVDYGCGQSRLADILAAKAGIATVRRYDPAIPDLAEPPAEPFDLLINVDVLEHVPDDELDAVMAEMAAMARHALIVIDTRPAKLILSDGRNAHVSLHDGPTWAKRLARHWPAVKPIPILRKGRVAFKTFDAGLPAVVGAAITTREVLARKLGRLLPRAGR